MKTKMRKFVGIVLSVIFLTTVFNSFVGVTAAAAEVDGSTVVYATKTGECYHTEKCSCLSKSKIETTLQQAVDSGLKPCSKCKPPKLDESSKNEKGTSINSVSNSQGNTVYITDTGTKYHAAGCASLKKSSIPISKDDAIDQGYTACKKCKP